MSQLFIILYDLSATGSVILDAIYLDLHWTLHFAPDVYCYIKKFLLNCDYNMFKFNLLRIADSNILLNYDDENCGNNG